MAHETVDVFRKLDTRRRHLRTKRAGAEAMRGPHLVRLSKGAVPEYIRLNPYEAFCWRVMGDFVRGRGVKDETLEENLLKAHMKIRPEEYMAYVYMTAIITGVLGISVTIIFGLVLFLIIGIIGIVIMPLGILMPMMTFFLLKSAPASKAKSRGRAINKRITSAMSFISAMASANVPVDVIFKELARQPVYGEIKNEAEWITRDTELLGRDILTAVKQGASRSPSIKFQDFLQGVVTTSTSGGQLKPYFLAKAEQFEKEDKLEMRSKMETLAMMAESFVTVVVAFPLFLVVILAIMAIIGGTAQSTVLILWMVTVLMIPLSQVGFIFVIWSLSQD
ncbi:MAG: type II secretion system F family protein [Candidatus Thermoplasmatota archaeon]